jgi:DNA (cytosine-5)-methyltransferase 1
VANYEIADFPVCLTNERYALLIAKSTEFLLSTYKNVEQGQSISNIEDFHDALVGLAYGLTPQMIGRVFLVIDPIRQSRVVNFAEKIESGLPINDFYKSKDWFNHYISALSGLDEQIIKYVPQGGNWQDIPEYVPSQRLKQIREMSAERGVVRTTYYGRLRPEQPSYTIATYYNRPGNGTNIHPWEDRTLSSREAARLQSFPDSYLFFGSEGGIRTQIGNAVPPLLAYSLGKYLGDKYGYGTCVDAFAGAGGLSLGLELAGWDVIAANDNDKHAAITYRMNRLSAEGETLDEGRTAFVEGDIADFEIKNLFLSVTKKKLKGKTLDLLVGGPPCQGFSHAGFRRKDDTRNNLASLYLELALELQPKTFVLENVEGLLSYNSGQVVRDIIQALKDMGYKIEEPWVLNAEQFGVPQMRRRVLLVANKEEVVPKLPPRFRKCPGRRMSQPILDAHLSMPVTTGEALIDLPPLKKRRYTKGLAEASRLYSKWLRGVITTGEFLALRSESKE